MSMETAAQGVEPRSSWQKIAWVLAPVILLLVALWWLLAGDLLRHFSNGAPPVEALTVERTILDENGLRLLVRGGGSEPMKIAQVQVDAAYWRFTQTPPGEIERGSTAWIAIPFPWVLAEAHKVTFLTNTGATFDHEIPVAVETPKPTSLNFAAQAMLGAFVGIVPVVIGLLFYPALRGAGANVMNFLLAMTIGLLVFLLIDTMEDALEFAGRSAAIFQGPMMVILAAAASFIFLLGISRRRGVPSGLALATYIAIGIGLHNLGEGLAIGAAFAAGAAGLGAFLVMGFTLHNITEGVGIAAPLLKIRPTLTQFALLALIAGGPAVIGMWAGSLAYAPHWSALALAIGAGAILQVVVEVWAFLARSSADPLKHLMMPPVLTGVATGLVIMYGTAMLVKI
jgi:ZIP family zinc transporter